MIYSGIRTTLFFPPCIVLLLLPAIQNNAPRSRLVKVDTVTWFSGAGKSWSKESPVITLTDVLLDSGLNFVISL